MTNKDKELLTELAALTKAQLLLLEAVEVLEAAGLKDWCNPALLTVKMAVTDTHRRISDVSSELCKEDK